MDGVGDCGKEIPLIRIPYLYNEEEHYSILRFKSIYQSVDNLWMNSLSDRFTKRQIINEDSQLNKMGLDIRSELENKVGKPVYLFIANPIGGWFEFEKNNKNLDVCPKCGGEFRMIDNNYADKVCDKCRLAFITH
jgi:predicted  nucleic acid-binding Zn ribbon protein